MIGLGRLTLSALLPAAVAAASLAAAAPASAAVTGSTSTTDVVLYQECQQHPISYDVEVTPGTTYWRLELQVFDAKGDTSQGQVLTSATSPAHGTVSWTFCGSETPGTYTVRGNGFYRTVPGTQTAYSLPQTSFEVRPMATRTRLTQERAARGRHLLTATVVQQGRAGFDRADGIPVRLERRTASGWQRVRGLALTTVHGKATALVRRAGAYRAVVLRHGNRDASQSRVVTLRG